MKRGDSVGKTYFKHRSVHKYTRVAKGQSGMKTKGIIDLVLEKREMLRYVQYVKAVRGMERDLSDHYVILCKFRLGGTWNKRREVPSLGGGSVMV